MDGILLVVFSYLLYKKAQNKGLRPWPYVINYIAAFLLVSATAYSILYSAFGKDFPTDEKAMTSSLGLSTFFLSYTFEIAAFVYLRRRIQKVRVIYEEDEDRHDTPPSEEKKDLSYFR